MDTRQRFDSCTFDEVSSDDVENSVCNCNFHEEIYSCLDQYSSSCSNLVSNLDELEALLSDQQKNVITFCSDEAKDGNVKEEIQEDDEENDSSLASFPGCGVITLFLL
eukprot:Awhi_evm3s7782